MSTLALLLDSTVRISLILAAALATLAFLRARPAALRHWVLAAAIVCAAASPLAAVVLPAWNLGVSSSWPSRTGPAPAEAAAAHSGGPAVSGVEFRLPGPTSRQRSGWSVTAALVRLWMVGAGAFLAVLLVGVVRLRWLSRRAHAPSAAWIEQGDRVARRYGLRRPVRFLQSRHPTLLVTWGWVRPAVILPAGAEDWSEERMQIVCAHELAHVARADWPVQLLAELLRAISWFNPLAWVACRRLRQESERSCDDAVLRLGVNGCDYATHLVDLARELGRQRGMRLPALAMARPSSLEGRVSAMVNTRLDRRTVARSARLTTLLAALALAVPVAAIQGASSTLTGVVLDPMQKVTPAVKITVKNVDSETIHETFSDGSGRYQLEGLPAGTYRVTASRPGFKTHVIDDVVLNGWSTEQLDFGLEIGSLVEAVTIMGDPFAIAAAPSRPAAPRPLAWSAAATPDCVSGPTGGQVKEPRKIRDVKPSYPAEAAAAGASGVVILEGVIDTSGEVYDVKVLREPDAELSAAAAEAVRQWRYTPTLLNCEPVEVIMTVTVNFDFRQRD